MFFFFKQKTAYEIKECDWSSECALPIFPFIVLGLLIEYDVIRVPVRNRVIKICVGLLFAVPVFLFGLLNFIAPRLPDVFWDAHPALEPLWIMEGKWSPLVLMVIVVLFVLLYLLETIGGELTK